MTHKKSPHLEESHEGEESAGEIFMTSFADMVSLLMGFFIIMYSLSQKDDKKFSEFGKAISAGFSDDDKADPNKTSIINSNDYKREARAFQMMSAILNLGDREEAINKTESLYIDKLKKDNTQKTLTTHQKEMSEMNAKITAGMESGNTTLLDITIPAEKLFESGSTKLTNEAITKAKKMASLLKQIENVGQFNIIGHTDSRPTRGEKDNWQLSSERAHSFAKILMQSGIDEKRILISGKAGIEPMYPEYNKNGSIIVENLAKNRRIQIKIEKRKVQM